MAMKDRELCALIDEESRNSIGVADSFAADREKALQFYMGEAKGELSPPEVEGRSRVVSKDLMDTIEWAMPGIMEALDGANDIVSFKPRSQGDEKGADDATKYVNYLIHEENEGFVTIHDAVKSCLMQRMGVTKTYCDKSEEVKEERYEGCSHLEVDALSQDPDIEVVSVEPYGMVPQAGMMEGMPPELGQTFTVKVKRTTEQMQFKNEGVPPEEIRISKDCRTIADVRYIAHEVQRTESDLISMGWPKDEVKKLASGESAEGDYERDLRHDFDNSQDNDYEGDKSQRKITVTEAYIRVDFDGDGVAEYRKVVKAGSYIHENEVTDDHPFSLFTPILMPYKVIGLSFYDLVEDLQRIKTALNRQLLDNAYLANNPQTDVIEGQVNLDDLLNPRPGGIRRMKSMGAIQSNPIPFIGAQALAVIQAVDQVRDMRTGVTETNSALNAESLAKGAVGSEGVQALMSAGAQRQKLVARVLAETGIKRMYQLMLKLVTQYQNRPEQIQINGRWLEVDPREWKNNYKLIVNVGIGTASRAQQVANLTMILQAQKEAVAAGLATPQNIHHALTSLVRAMGYKDEGEFFSPPQPPKDPGPPLEVQLEQMRQQGAQKLAQIKGQIDAQLAQVKAQSDVQVAQMTQEYQAQQQQLETQMDAERNAAQMQNDMALEQYKTEQQMQLEMAKAQIAQQTAIELARINAEATAYAASLKPEPDADD